MRKRSPSTDTVVDVPKYPMFRQSGASFVGRNKIIAANDVGSQMKLVHWRRLEQLGYLRDYSNSSAEVGLLSVIDLERPKQRSLW